MAVTCSGCLQWAFVCLSVAAAAGGVTLLGVGVTALARDEWQLVALLNAALCPAVGVVLAVIGCVVTVLATLAVCGARLDDRRLLRVFFWLTLALLVVLGVALVVGIAMGALTVLEDVRGGMKESIGRYNVDGKVRQQWDNMQVGFQCCGVDDPTDWAHVLGHNEVPSSCCQTDKMGPQRCTASNGSYNVGCVRKMSQIVETYSAVIGATSAAVEVVLLVTTVASFALTKSSEDANRYTELG